MTTNFYESSLLFVFVFAYSFACPQIAQAQEPSVVIKTYGQHFGGSITYHHQITNNDSRNIVGVAIGLDTDETSSNVPATREQGELNFVMPIGSGVTELRIDPASISGPVGWTAEIIQIEDGGRYLQWRRPPRPGLSLQPGQMIRLSVTVPALAPVYLTGHFSAGYADGKNPWYYNGVMEKLDTTPPKLTLSLSPNTLQENDKLTPITANINVKDDYDPTPEIKLESITANELLETEDILDARLGTDDRQFMLKAKSEGKNKAGRIYTVVYSATDASGNRATATATVIVRHDNGERDEHKDKSSRN